MTTHTLESLCLAIVDCPHSTPVWTETGVLVLRSPNIRGGRLDLSEKSFTDEAHFAERIRRAEPRGGDLVITREAPMGEVAMISAGLRCCLGQRMVLLRPDPERVVGRYLLFALQSAYVRSQIMWAEGTGSTVSNLRIPDLKRLNVPVPDREAQEAIASALGALDDKLELNRRMSQTLEAMAQAIFQSWFVDFDGAPVNVQMRESTLGAEVARCGGLIQTGPFGSQLHAAEYLPVGVPVVMPQDMQDRRIHHARIAKVSEAKAATLARHRLNMGDVVYSRRGNVERHALVGLREAGWLCGTGCLLVRPGAAWPSQAYLSEWLNRPEARTWLRQHAVGATMPNLNTGILAALPIEVPNDAALTAFEQRLSPLREAQIALASEAETLAALRDTLLPRLLSGELTPAAA